MVTLGCPFSCLPLAPRHGTCKCRFIYNALSSTVTSTFWTCLESGTRHSAVSGRCVGGRGWGVWGVVVVMVEVTASWHRSGLLAYGPSCPVALLGCGGGGLGRYYFMDCCAGTGKQGASALAPPLPPALCSSLKSQMAPIRKTFKSGGFQGWLWNSEGAGGPSRLGPALSLRLFRHRFAFLFFLLPHPSQDADKSKGKRSVLWATWSSGKGND